MKTKRIRDDDIRLWQSLFNMLSSLNNNNDKIILERIFYMEDEEFCQLIWISYNNLLKHKNELWT